MNIEQKQGRIKSQQGFTLVELMVVIGIMALGWMLALPSYQDWIARRELGQAVSEIASQLSLSKMAAMNRNRTVTTTIQLNSGVVSVGSVDSTGQTVMPSQNLGRHVTQLPPSNAAVTVNFSSLGRLTGGTQTIQIKNDRSLTYTIIVTPTGKITACDRATACP